jgi:putative hydrolase of HD superfamily
MLFDFFNTVAELKKIPRKGWKEKVGLQSPESVADHSYNTAVMAMVLSDLKELDTEKILRMALLHDIAESVTGDFTPEEISKKEKKKIENSAMLEILSKLPSKLASNYTKIWEEYQNGTSKEAILVHEIDRLEMALQAWKYRDDGYPKEKLEVFFSTAKKEIKSKEVLALLGKIYK